MNFWDNFCKQKKKKKKKIKRNIARRFYNGLSQAVKNYLLIYLLMTDAKWNHFASVINK